MFRNVFGSQPKRWVLCVLALVSLAGCGYSGFPLRNGQPYVQSQDWLGDMYVNPTGQLSEFSWGTDPMFGNTLNITQDDAHAADGVNGKVLVGPHLFSESEPKAIKNFNATFEVYLPSGLPLVGMAPNYPWFQVAEIEGMPNDGSPPIGLDVSGFWSGGRYNQWVLNRDAAHGYDFPWRGPAVTYDTWHKLSVNVCLSESESVGYVEIAVDGIQQRFVDGSTRLHYATLGPGVKTGPERFILDQYRGKGLLSGNYTVRLAAPQGTPLSDPACT